VARGARARGGAWRKSAKERRANAAPLASRCVRAHLSGAGALRDAARRERTCSAAQPCGRSCAPLNAIAAAAREVDCARCGTQASPSRDKIC
jgi:hypothetical protein